MIFDNLQNTKIKRFLWQEKVTSCYATKSENQLQNYIFVHLSMAALFFFNLLWLFRAASTLFTFDNLLSGIISKVDAGYK